MSMLYERCVRLGYLCSLFLDTLEQLVKQLVPTLERLGEIPRSRRIPRGGRGLFTVVHGMQRCDERREKRFEELDKERFHGGEEIVDIGELQDALVRDLWKRGG